MYFEVRGTRERLMQRCWMTGPYLASTETIKLIKDGGGGGGGGGDGGSGRGRLYTRYRYSVITRMIPVLRCRAADESHFNVSVAGRWWTKSQRALVTSTLNQPQPAFEEKGREPKPSLNRGPASAYQPNALPLGQMAHHQYLFKTRGPCNTLSTIF